VKVYIYKEKKGDSMKKCDCKVFKKYIAKDTGEVGKRA